MVNKQIQIIYLYIHIWDFLEFEYDETSPIDIVTWFLYENNGVISQLDLNWRHCIYVCVYLCICTYVCM